MNSIAVSSSSILALLIGVVAVAILLAIALHWWKERTGICPECGSRNRQSTSPLSEHTDVPACNATINGKKGHKSTSSQKGDP